MPFANPFRRKPKPPPEGPFYPANYVAPSSGGGRLDAGTPQVPNALIAPTVVSRPENQARITTLYERGPQLRSSKTNAAPRSSLFQPTQVPAIAVGRYGEGFRNKVTPPSILVDRDTGAFIRGATFKGYKPPVQQGSIRGGSVMRKQPMYQGTVAYPRATASSPVYRTGLA